MFVALFDEKQVKVCDPDSIARLSVTHVAITEGKDLGPEELIWYLARLWDYIAFVRSPEAKYLKASRQLEFHVGRFKTNSYWWSILTRTNQLAEMVLEERPAEEISDEESKVQAESVRNVKRTISLLRQCTTWITTHWTDRTENKEFKESIAAELKKCEELKRTLRIRALKTHGFFSSRNAEEADKASQMYITAFDLSKDTECLARAVYQRSIALHRHAKFGEAIAYGREYEKLLKGVVHKHMQEWIKVNTEAGIKQSVPAEISIASMPRSESYTEGETVKPIKLFEVIKPSPQVPKPVV